MRVLKIEEGKATIEIDGDEMCVLREGIYSMKDKTCFGADRRDKLMNDISALYSIARCVVKNDTKFFRKD